MPKIHINLQGEMALLEVVVAELYSAKLSPRLWHK